MCRTARQLFACGMAAVVFLIARPARAHGDMQPSVHAHDDAGVQGRRAG